MKAIRFHAHGGPEVLRYEEVPAPAPGTGQILIRVEAVGVNFIEVYQRTGLYSVNLPAIPGSECAGVVAAIGAGVSGFAAGDRVASASALSTYAGMALAAAERVVHLPAEIATRQGAALMLQGMTAHYLACSARPLGSGDTCLVHAAAGGVGLLLCQIARLRGARVIGTASSAEKAALARAAGASDVILYTRENFETEVRRLTGGAGVQVVYDSVGRTTFDGSLGALAPRGLMVLFGQSSGPVPPMDPQLLNRKGSLFLTRPTLAHYIATRAELEQRARDLFGWVREGRLEVRVGAEFALAEAGAAHAALESRSTTGKVLLIPRD